MPYIMKFDFMYNYKLLDRPADIWTRIIEWVYVVRSILVTHFRKQPIKMTKEKA
jgi:hypothetical protein